MPIQSLASRGETWLRTIRSELQSWSQNENSATSGSHLELSPGASTNGARLQECSHRLLYFSLSE